MPPLDPGRWRALGVLAVAQFMVILDATIVNVALPAIQQDLGFDIDELSWVVNAYVLMFGGFLLLGGRLADVLGRRRMFLAGLALFATASLAGGLAPSGSALIAARAVQGLGAALLSPAALSLVTSLFPAGRERNTALGIWGALAGLGGTAGVVLGGVLVDAVGWEWVLFVNVPVAIAAVPAALRLVPESRAERRTAGFDVVGAVTATSGVLTLVYAVVRTDINGWGSATTVALLAVAAALLAGFVAQERRSPAPLVPLRLLRERSTGTANMQLLLSGGAFISMFFLTAIYLQQVLGMSAVQAGLAFVPMGAAAIAAAATASQLVSRVGTRPVLIAGGAITLAGLALLALAAGSEPRYVTDVLPGIVVYGFGLPLIGVSSTITAVDDARRDDAGAASGLANASQQIGGALLLAVAVTISTTHVASQVAAGVAQDDALASGFQRGLLVAAAAAAANLALGVIRSVNVRPAPAEVAAVLEAEPAPVPG